MNELMRTAINSMNYFFLKETFSEINKVKECIGDNMDNHFMGKGYNLYEAHIEELSLFLSELVNNYDETVEEIITIEMEEGSYVDDLTLDEVKEKLESSIEFILGDKNDEVLNIYLNIAKKIQVGLELKIVTRCEDYILYYDSIKTLAFEVKFDDSEFNGEVLFCENIGSDEEDWDEVKDKDIYDFVKEKAIADYNKLK